jgi:hypothetical protein
MSSLKTSDTEAGTTSSTAISQLTVLHIIAVLDAYLVGCVVERAIDHHFIYYADEET